MYYIVMLFIKLIPESKIQNQCGEKLSTRSNHFLYDSISLLLWKNTWRNFDPLYCVASVH